MNDLVAGVDLLTEVVGVRRRMRFGHREHKISTLIAIRIELLPGHDSNDVFPLEAATRVVLHHEQRALRRLLRPDVRRKNALSEYPTASAFKRTHHQRRARLVAEPKAVTNIRSRVVPDHHPLTLDQPKKHGPGELRRLSITTAQANIRFGRAGGHERTGVERTNLDTADVGWLGGIGRTYATGTARYALIARRRQ